MAKKGSVTKGSIKQPKAKAKKQAAKAAQQSKAVDDIAWADANMGFDDIVGFTEEVGFEHSTVIKKSYGDRFFEQEGYE